MVADGPRKGRRSPIVSSASETGFVSQWSGYRRRRRANQDRLNAIGFWLRFSDSASIFAR